MVGRQSSIVCACVCVCMNKRIQNLVYTPSRKSQERARNQSIHLNMINDGGRKYKSVFNTQKKILFFCDLTRPPHVPNHNVQSIIILHHHIAWHRIASHHTIMHHGRQYVHPNAKWTINQLNIALAIIVIYIYINDDSTQTRWY